MSEPITYKEAGVDIDKADAFVKSIRHLVKATHRTGVIGEIGGFGGLFHLDIEKYRNPVLVSATDGVGTKIKIAVLLDRHHTIGIDLVAMCVNDIITCGATPLLAANRPAVPSSAGKLPKCRECISPGTTT
jgi:phosphoribosylformylglycinamidine cyclo-ligase